MDNMGLFFLPTGGALSVVVTGDGAHFVRLEDYFASPVFLRLISLMNKSLIEMQRKSQAGFSRWRHRSKCRCVHDSVCFKVNETVEAEEVGSLNSILYDYCM